MTTFAFQAFTQQVSIATSTSSHILEPTHTHIHHDWGFCGIPCRAVFLPVYFCTWHNFHSETKECNLNKSSVFLGKEWGGGGVVQKSIFVLYVVITVTNIKNETKQQHAIRKFQSQAPSLRLPLILFHRSVCAFRRNCNRIKSNRKRRTHETIHTHYIVHRNSESETKNKGPEWRKKLQRD